MVVATCKEIQTRGQSKEEDTYQTAVELLIQFLTDLELTMTFT